MNRFLNTIKPITLTFLGWVSVVAAMQSQQEDLKIIKTPSGSEMEELNLPLLPRSLFAWTTKGQLSLKEQALLKQIKANTGISPYAIYGNNEADNILVFKTRETGGYRLFIYDNEWEDYAPLERDVLEDPHPYVHVETITPDTIYWSYFENNTPPSKRFYTFSIADQINTP